MLKITENKFAKNTPVQSVTEQVETSSDMFNVIKPIQGLKRNNNNFEIQSNIDGYTQSDIFEGDSNGYLQNSKRMLDRFKHKEPSRCKIFTSILYNIQHQQAAWLALIST